jgi:hypothetical protein
MGGLSLTRGRGMHTISLLYHLVLRVIINVLYCSGFSLHLIGVFIFIQISAVLCLIRNGFERLFNISQELADGGGQNAIPGLC